MCANISTEINWVMYVDTIKNKRLADAEISQIRAEVSQVGMKTAMK